MRALHCTFGASPCLALALAYIASVTLPRPTLAQVRLATTTSVENSGLLRHLLAQFEQTNAVHVQVLPVGSGQALQLAARGDVDAVLSHAPELEDEALAQGTVVEAQAVMETEIVLVGPANDPAQVRATDGISQAMALLATRQVPFLSRGDRSGTHSIELALWRKVGIQPTGSWYQESGQGMGATLMMASERQSYTLADRATFLAYRGRQGLAVLVRDHPPLKSVYRALLARPDLRPRATWLAAHEFVRWLVSPAGQKAIADFRIDGEVVFIPVRVASGS